ITFPETATEEKRATGDLLTLIKAYISPSNMRKLIKNYTTDIPVEKTITEIQKILAQNGARGIALEYDEQGNIKDIFFKIILHELRINNGYPNTLKVLQI